MSDTPLNLSPSQVDAARRHDPDAIVAVYRALSGPVYAYLLRRTRDPSWADDLTADVFLEAMKALDRFEGTPDALRAWIFRIARNTAVDHFRKQSYRRHDPIEDARDVSAPEAGPEEAALSTIATERIVALVDELPDDQREVVLLRIVSDLPIAETAKILGKSEGAVKSLQHRALRRLARAMEEGSA